jgi:quercetin dioxygenase-like cupin family protein
MNQLVQETPKGNTGDVMVAQLNDMIEFSSKRRIRKSVVRSKDVMVELLCYEPGQGTPVHHHVGQDEVFYTIQGHGTLTLNGECRSLEPNQLYLVPKMIEHGLQNDTDRRLIMIFFKPR